MEIIVQLKHVNNRLLYFQGAPRTRCTEEKTSTSKKHENNVKITKVKITRVKVIKTSIQVEFSQSIQVEFSQSIQVEFCQSHQIDFSLKGYIFSLHKVQNKCRRCKFVEISLLDSCYGKVNIIELNFLINGIKSCSCGFRDGWSIVVEGGGGAGILLRVALNQWCQTLRGNGFNRRWWRSSISNYIDMWGWRWTSRGGEREKLCHDVSATNAGQHQVHHADTKVDMDPSVVTVTKTFCCHCFNIDTNVDAAAAEMEDTEDQGKSLQGAHVHTTSLHWSRYTTGLFLLLYERDLRSAIVN